MGERRGVMVQSGNHLSPPLRQRGRYLTLQLEKNPCPALADPAGPFQGCFFRARNACFKEGSRRSGPWRIAWSGREELALKTMYSIILFASATAMAEPTLIPLGSSTQVTSISGDGSVIVGSIGGSVFRWTESTGTVILGGVSNGNPSVSTDGSTIVGTAVDSLSGLETAAIWQGGTSWSNIGGIPGGSPSGSSLSSGWGVSGDGSVVVGLGWIDAGTAHGFRWEQSTGVVDLGSTVNGQSCRANEVSGDGQRVVGWQSSSSGSWDGVYWENGVQVPITTSSGSSVGDANAVNSNGSVIVGAFLGGQAWRWTEATGAVAIGVLPGWNFKGYAFDVTEDGSIVVGACGFGWDRDAFIWTQDTGMLKLDTWLSDQGLDLSGWDLGSATGISDDGSVITGWGFGPGGVEGWVVTLEEDSPADINGDGLVDVNDLLMVIGGWGPCSLFCPADINDDGNVDVIDLLLVIQDWS